MGIYTRAIIRLLLAFTFLYLLFFVLGGDRRWWQGWLLYGILCATVIANMLVLRTAPDLLQERMKPLFQPGQPLSDRVLLSCFLACYLGWYIIQPLDHRAGWTSAWPVWLNAIGALLCIAGAALVNICFAQNRFLSAVVRVQSERGHHVVDTGLYAVVRHPMYSGILLLLLGGSLLTGSLWGTVVAVFANVFLFLRAIQEERTLARELPGYTEYMSKVRYRLIPGIL